MAQGFFYSPLGAEDDFDAQQKELERRRKLASAFETQLGQAPPANASTKYKIGALIGNALSGGVAGVQEAELNKQSEDYSKRREDFTKNWLASMPRGTPEQQAIPQPAADLGGGPERPMIPRAFPSRDEMTAWQGKGLPLGADADRLGAQAVAGMALDQQRDATNALTASALEERRRAEVERALDRAADNKRQERELLRHIQADETTAKQREAYQGDLVRLREDSNAIARLALENKIADREGKASADQKEITGHIKAYGTALTKEKLPQVDMLLGNVEKMIADYAEKKKPLPGVGLGANALPAVVFGDEGVKVRATITPLRRLITTSEAGLSQTISEMKGVLENMGLTAMSPESAFLEAIPHLREVINSRKATLESSYRPEAVEEFNRRVTAPAAPTTPEQSRRPLSDFKTGNAKVDANNNVSEIRVVKRHIDASGKKWALLSNGQEVQE